jgi:hypothetical protein
MCHDGALTATFTPTLNDEQYIALREAIQHDGETRENLARLLRKLGNSWGCEVMLDPC